MKELYAILSWLNTKIKQIRGAPSMKPDDYSFELHQEVVSECVDK